MATTCASGRGRSSASSWSTTRDPLPPEELALLAQRTEGWAAGLQLFHLATRGKPPSERRATLAALRARWKAAREYLADNVLHDLPPVLREFLVRTSVLTVLSGELCNALLGRKGSERAARGAGAQADLHDRARRRGPLSATTRCCARSSRRSSWTARATRRRRPTSAAPASCSRPTAALPDALRAYSRAEDWEEAVRRLLGKSGEELVDGRVGWIDLLPASLVHDDPWLQLARARQERAAGRFERAIETYGEAERSSGRAAAAELCRRERLALEAWIEPAPPPPTLADARPAPRRDDPRPGPRAARRCS